MVPATSTHYQELEWYGDRWEFQRVFEITRLSDASILEIGCGEGHFITHANRHRNHVVGIDFNSDVIAKCKQRGLDAELICMDTVRLEKFSHAEKAFDMVACYHVIEHLKNIQEFLDYCRKALKKDGFLVFSTPNKNRANVYFNRREWWDYPPHHLTWWSEKAMRKVLQRSGFELVTIESEPLYFRDIHRNVVSSTLDLLPGQIGRTAWSYRCAYYFMFIRSALLYLSSNISKVISGNTILVVARINPAIANLGT